MNKSIALMTWYKNNNFGSVLQCYALQKTLKKMGNNVSIINYSPKSRYYEDKNNFFYKKLKKSLLFKTKYKPFGFYERKEKFDEFRNEHFIETIPCSNFTDLASLNENFDVFVCGSDQIWNLSDSFDDNYFLPFVNVERKLCYAASFGVTNPKKSSKLDMASKLISNFKYISCREDNGVDLVKRIAKVDSVHVADPTLLIESSEWLELADKSNIKLEGKYIICYFLGNYKKYIHSVKKISKHLGIPYLIIPTYVSQKRNIIKENIGPNEFLSLLKNASYVCTDSYHGMLFSINFNVPFSIFERFKGSNSENTRIYSAVNKFGFQDRINKISNLNCDFCNANLILNNFRQESISFLRNSLMNLSDRNMHHSVCHSLCTGCGACQKICPKSAIIVEKDEDGFFNYKKNTSCIECGLCSTVCPVLNSAETDLNAIKEVFAFSSKKEQCINSSSGGAAYELCESFLNAGYIVFGAYYDSETNSVTHISISNSADLGKIQGSKYLQSDCKRIYDLVDKNQKIVFIGTPCQVAGLNNYLIKRNKRDNLILIDLICHGVPTQLLWKKCIEYFEKKYGNIKSVVFREKSKGWHKKIMSIESFEKKFYINEKDNPFYFFFNSPLCLSPYCYDCQFKYKSSADIRLGDFWGKEFSKCEKGVSMIIPVTKMGYESLQYLKKDCIVKRGCDYFTSQSHLSPKKPLFFNEIIEDFKDENKSITSIRKKYKNFVNKLNFMAKLRYLINKFFK